ncbi:MAG: molybdopterin-dependent oxidoreductase [Anaerolineae bacterium]|nr:molybdopterin-dependent oxidoreductase [Anaerolineae bacterium]
MPSRPRAILTGAVIGAVLTVPLVALMYLGERIAGLTAFFYTPFERLTRLPQLGGVVTKAIDVMVGVFSSLPGVATDAAAKSAEQFSAIILFIVLGAIVGAIYGYFWLRDNRARGVTIALIAWLITLGLEFGAKPVTQLLFEAIWLGVLYLAWGWALSWSLDRLLVTTTFIEPNVDLGRRTFLFQFGGMVLALTVGAWGIGSLFGRREASGTAGKPIASLSTQPAATQPSAPSGAFIPAPGTRAEVTPNKDFYRVDNNVAGPPGVDEKTWKLKVGGLVNKPLEISYDDLIKMPATQQDATLECISNPVGGDLISSTRWTGVKLHDLLIQAGLKDGVTEIKFTCADGYTESLPLESAMDQRTLLTYAMNGEALSSTHGFPLRLYVPNRYGMKNPKWITEIEAIDQPYSGYWEVRGWDKEAIVKATAVIDTIAVDQAADGIVPVGGIAFAGSRGISTVEVSVDNGPWQVARLKAPISPLMWVLWRFDWQAEKGNHTLRVRTTDGQGAPQIDKVADLHPDGASGYHSRSADV